MGAVEDEEDDYMNMVIEEPTQSREKETYTQRRIRKEREAEVKGRTKSKAEKAAEEAAAREAALSQSLDPSNKGYKMMAKLGFKLGSALGKDPNARTEPVGLEVKEDRGGIGLDAERKRKFREQVDQEAKRVKAEEGEYRERVRQEREEKRLEGQIIGAQKVAERLDTKAEESSNFPEQNENGGSIDHDDIPASNSHRKVKPTKEINVLWRGLVRHRAEVERERRIRYDLHQSLSRLPTYQDPEEEAEDKKAIEREDKDKVLEEDVEEEDPELEEFKALASTEQLGRIVQYLRDTYHYCFWCKYQYPDAQLEGCPGLTEEDHD